MFEETKVRRSCLIQEIISYLFLNLYETEFMQEKLTILVSSENKKFLKKHARQHNKSMSQYIDDLLSSAKRLAPKSSGKDEWLEKTAGSYRMGAGDVLNELFKDIKR